MVKEHKALLAFMGQQNDTDRHVQIQANQINEINQTKSLVCFVHAGICFCQGCLNRATHCVNKRWDAASRQRRHIACDAASSHVSTGM